MSQRPFSPPPSFFSPVSFNLSQLVWKGFLQVDFSEDEDHIALGLLARMEVEFSR